MSIWAVRNLPFLNFVPKYTRGEKARFLHKKSLIKKLTNGLKKKFVNS